MANVISINENNFDEEVLNQSGTVLVDFYTERCGPCQQMAPVLDGLTEKLSENVKVVKVEASDNYKLAREYNISSVPAFVLFEDGEMKKSKTGVMPPAQLKRWIEE